jgi:hypothetical protein
MLLRYLLKIKILLIVKLFNTLNLMRFIIRLTVFKESNLLLLIIKDNN